MLAGDDTRQARDKDRAENGRYSDHDCPHERIARRRSISHARVSYGNRASDTWLDRSGYGHHGGLGGGCLIQLFQDGETRLAPVDP